MSLRPLHDHCVVEMEPVKEFSRGGIIMVAPEPVRVGRVVSIGPGRRYQKTEGSKEKFVRTELKVGERIAFFQAVTQTQQGYLLHYRLPENQALLRETDALFVLPEGVDVEVTR